MTTEYGHGPEPLLIPDATSLIQRYAPELERAPAVDRISAYFGLSMLALFVGLGGYNLFGVVGGVVVAVVLVILGVSGFENYRRRVVAAFEERLQTRPWELYGEIAERFRRDLAAQRSRLLGPRSEWGRARAPLEDAFHEAQRSVAYWTERSGQDPDQPVAREHLDTARQLSEKFRAALDELDARSGILLDFFNTCEAKLAALEYSKRDVEESERLARLSDRSDEVRLDAERAMAGIGGDVLRHALEVGQALGAVERLRIQHAAGDLPVDQIETVADRILASADAERRILTGLVSEVGPDED